jgi:hypothetical protein
MNEKYKEDTFSINENVDQAIKHVITQYEVEEPDSAERDPNKQFVNSVDKYAAKKLKGLGGLKQPHKINVVKNADFIERRP